MSNFKDKAGKKNALISNTNGKGITSGIFIPFSDFNCETKSDMISFLEGKISFLKDRTNGFNYSYFEITAFKEDIERLIEQSDRVKTLNGLLEDKKKKIK